MNSIKFTQNKGVGRIAGRLQFAIRKYKEANEKLKELLEMGQRVVETAEYSEAKMEVLYWQKRISDLRKLQPMTGAEKHQKKVSLGSTVKVKYGTVDREYTIVTSVEADPVNGFISKESPLGRALLNRQENESVTVDTPSGQYNYKVLGVA
jgi:transcription elongation factor GreA